MAQMENHKYCVYLTEYKGDKLPQFYIGSSSIEKVQNGYNGSVSSKKYGKIYKQEQKENKHLFETLILRSCINRKFALKAENYIQKQYNVVKSELFMNQSFARGNGFHGMDNSGATNSFYGKHHSSEAKKKMSKAWETRVISEETKKKMSIASKGRIFSEESRIKKSKSLMGHKVTEETRKKLRNANLGKLHTEKAIKKMSESKKGDKNSMFGKTHSVEIRDDISNKLKLYYENAPLLKCPYCEKTSKSKPNMKRYHFDNCKYKKEII